MMKSYKKVLLLITICMFGSSLFFLRAAQAHCQIPCGIYDDYARVESMLEDTATIEKSIKMIGELAGKSDAHSKNQLVRWVMNKEKHAQNIISTICDYFLTQRVKPSQKDYMDRLKKHHAVIIAAMQAKQHADEKYAKKLKESIETLLSFYPKEKH